MNNITTMALAGVKPTRKAPQFDREEAEDRAYRLLSEGELFYVETDIPEDLLVPNRHDHGHVGGVSLEIITAARAQGGEGQQLASPPSKGPGSDSPSAHTAATSRSSSQDTEENDSKMWQQHARSHHVYPYPQQQQQQLPFAGLGARVLAVSPEPFYPNGNRISLREAQEWDFQKKLEDIELSETRNRQRSFSEPRLTSLRAGGGANHVNHLEWHSPQQYHHHYQCQGANEGRRRGSGSGSGRKQVSPTLQRRRWDDDNCGGGGGGGGDPCAEACEGLRDGLERAWSRILGSLGGGRGGEGAWVGNHGIGTLRSRSPTRVKSVCRNFASCTSTKTYEMTPAYKEALQRLGVPPQTSTFTMHIAGYRLVSTILGDHAEYEVRMKGGGRHWSRWHRFSRFKTIAGCSRGDPDAAAAWLSVLRAKPHYRCLKPDYLALKCNLLEVFLQQVLFAMPTPAILIHFVSAK